MKVILFDDDPIYLEITAYRIQKEIENASVECVENLQQFLQLEEVEGKTLLLDLNLDKTSGWDIIDKLKTQQRLPERIYLCSSSIDPTDTSKASDHPLISDYIEKPVHPALLRSLLNGKA